MGGWVLNLIIHYRVQILQFPPKSPPPPPRLDARYPKATHSSASAFPDYWLLCIMCYVETGIRGQGPGARG